MRHSLPHADLVVKGPGGCSRTLVCGGGGGRPPGPLPPPHALPAPAAGPSTAHQCSGMYTMLRHSLVHVIFIHGSVLIRIACIMQGRHFGGAFAHPDFAKIIFKKRNK